MSSKNKIAANQANAQLSTGPTSETGKAKSSLNALKTGLTGRTVLLPTDDAELYEVHLAEFARRFDPKGEEEQKLVQSVADTEWRLLRIPALEMGIYAVGRLEFAELFANEEPAMRKQLVEAKVFLVYQRQLNNLSIQEGRLRRQLEEDKRALREVQERRKWQTEQRLDKAAKEYIDYVYDDRQEEFDPVALGFEFSFEEIEVRAMKLDRNLFAEYEQELREAREKKIA